MNIALFSDTYLPDINGVATSTHILKKELKKHGHHVLIVTTMLPHDSDYQDEDLYILRLHGLDLKKLYGYRASNIYSFKGMKELKEFQPDIIHIQTEFGIGIFGKIAGEILNIPVCYTYHTMWADYSHYIAPGNIKAVDYAAKKIIEKISKIYGDSCSELIVPSQKTADALREYGISNSINVIPTGLQLDKFSVNNKNQDYMNKIITKYHLQDKFVVTFLGRVAPEKSVDLLIEAMADIVKKNSHICMLIVGGGPQIEELEEMVHQYQLDSFVYFTGPKESELVPSFYHVSDLFVSASITETQGLTFIEAMASGIPVLARYDKNLEGVIINGRNGYFFRDKEDLVEKIIQLSDAPLDELIQNATSDAQQYSSEHFYEKIMKTYHKALSKHHYCYEVVSLTPDKGHTYNVAFQFDNHQVIINLSSQVIDRYGLNVGQVVDREELDALKDQEQVARAYHLALKYLTYKDYSYAKMQKKLSDKGDFDDIQIEMTMELLVQKNLIDDVEYTKNYFQKAKRMGVGVNKIIFNLKREGISPFVIDEYLADYSQDLEYDKAVEIVKKLYNENTSKPQYALIQNIKNKLFNKGFSQDVVERAINDFDFVFPKEHTKKLLTKEYQRVYNRYKNRYDPHILKSKVITFLVQKGYEYDDVIEIIRELWEDNND
ncbi:glycosyltransferase [Candidatus Stoquefichus massiliensis]|uniref:glycosyltransferase n=1 Tax=Candidatus Stoquefichus massiliensis TaxID=1470350 RepID=UPI0004874653|nr:RecX family transcriptional regulator [Candidatus Stoquefichus massiliensis]